MSAIDRAELRRVRGGWGWAFALAWIAFWWAKLGAQEKAAEAAIRGCSGFLQGMGCAMSRSAAQSGFAGGMLVVVLTAPLAWVVAHHVARWRVANAARDAAGMQERAEAARLATQQRDSAARLAQMDADARRAHDQVGRADVLQKLGAVGDYLDLLSAETDSTRTATMRLGVAQALRDVTANLTIAQIAALAGDDAAVLLSLRTTVRRLEASGLQGNPEGQILVTALSDAGD